jgi:hypothetical protein
VSNCQGGSEVDRWLTQRKPGSTDAGERTPRTTRKSCHRRRGRPTDRIAEAPVPHPTSSQWIPGRTGNHDTNRGARRRLHRPMKSS